MHKKPHEGGLTLKSKTAARGVDRILFRRAATSSVEHAKFAQQNMKQEKEALIVNHLGRRGLNPNISPSLRIAATTHNRSLLRWLRAVESIDWQDADPPAGFNRAWTRRKSEGGSICWRPPTARNNEHDLH